MTDSFFDYSQYYDLLYQDKDYPGEVAYVQRLLSQHGNQVRDVLELGCGTGRHAELLATNGFLVTGVEQSQSMLQQSLAQAERVRNSAGAGSFEPLAGDARTFSIDRKFDAVISLFHVVSYQTTNGDVNRMFATAARHLKPGGLFLFDVWYGPAVLFQKPTVRVKRLENEKIRLIRIAEPVLDVNLNTVEVNYSVLVTEKTSGRMDQITERHLLRYYFSPEIHLLADHHGLHVVKQEEWLTGNQPSADTWGVCFVLERS